MVYLGNHNQAGDFFSPFRMAPRRNRQTSPELNLAPPPYSVEKDRQALSIAPFLWATLAVA